MSLLINNTLANGTQPFYALASEGASNWYNFPSLTGTVTLVDASGAQVLQSVGGQLLYNSTLVESSSNWYVYPSETGEVLLKDASGVQIVQAVGGDLFFNGQLLAKAGDIENIADWSLYPAFDSVLFENKDISGVRAYVGSSINVSSLFANTASTSNLFGQSIQTSTLATQSLLTSSLTTSGIDMTNSSITRVNSLTIANGGLPPYGTLTSPDGVLLTWNGQTINTGGGGNVANWGLFNQVSSLSSITADYGAIKRLSTLTLLEANQVSTASLYAESAVIGNIAYGPNSIQSGGGALVINSQSNAASFRADSNVAIQSRNGQLDLSGNDINLTADTGISVFNTPIVNIVAQNGPLGGLVSLQSYSGFGELAGFGRVSLEAFGSVNNPATPVGGLIDINAYSAGQGEYGGLTSAVRIGGANVTLAAGAIPPLPGLAGFATVYGQGGLSLTASVLPPSPQLPGSTYVYGDTGVRLQSPLGVQMLSDMFAGTIFPIANGSTPLVIRGRSSPSAGVQLMDVESINMVLPNAQITGVSSLNFLSLNDPFNIGGVSTINGQPYPPPAGNAVSTFATASISSLGVSSIKGFDLSGAITVQSGGTLYLESAADVQLYGSSITNNATVNGTIDIIAGYGTAAPVSLSTVGGLVAGTSSRFRDATEFYVSGNGNDTTGNGSILAPFLTIQQAITQAELVSSAALICVINVASGHYVENLTFAKGYVVLNGSLQAQTGNEVCEITGSISIACVGADDVFNRQVTFQGFNLTCGAGQLISDTSSASHTVSFQDCKVFVDGQFFQSTATSPDMRFYMTNVEVQQTNAAATLPVITTNVGLAELERVDIVCTGDVSAIVVGGTCSLARLSLATLTATSSDTTLIPLLIISSSTLLTHSIGNVAFAFTSSSVKTNTNAFFIASSVNTAIIALNCVFTLVGTASSTNNCIGYNGVGSPSIAGINNTSLSIPLLLPQTVSVQTGITQFQYTNINPPVMGAYSKAADQTIAAANTPVAVVFQTVQFQQGTALATTRLQVSASGNYQINYSLQVTNPALSGTATSFLSRNGTAVANTGNQFSYPTNLQAHTSPQFILTLNAGDYIELFLNASTTGTIINATAAAPPLPAIPGAVISITQIR